MPRGDNGETRARKRVSNACNRCRRHKIKCSGTDPCHVCDHKGIRCDFGADDRKVVVSESTIQELRTRLKQLESQQEQQRPQGSYQPVHDPLVNVDQHFEDLAQDISHTPRQALCDTISDRIQQHIPVVGPSTQVQDVVPVDPALSPEDTSDLERTGVTNPLVPSQPHFIYDENGQLRYLGHSSTWSFTHQVLRMAYQSPQTNASSFRRIHIEGEAYPLGLGVVTILPSDIDGLPSMDLSFYYLQTVKFRTYPLYHLFDEVEFTSHLQAFYERPAEYAQEFSIWFVHYLIIMAFGKAFVTQRSSSNSRAGSELFTRALRLLPDVSFLRNDPVRSTEIFCCMALYLQSIDHRTAAIIRISEAVRMAQSFGLHNDLQADAVGPELVLRGHRIWWTVYALDRKLSCSMGVPITTPDIEITTPLPDVVDNGLTATSQAIHVKICQLLGKVINTVYSRDGEFNSAFLTTVQTVLRGVAGLANELRLFSERTFGEISKLTANLNLAYHHCIVLASRPFLFFILKHRLQHLTPRRTLPLSSSGKGLVQVCIDSAMQMVTILSELREHELLDAFLPFDLEYASSAAFVLVMASNVHPKLLPPDDWYKTIIEVFDNLAVKGNMLATFRRSEVEDLAQMLAEVGHRHKSGSEKIAQPPQDPPSVTPSDPLSLPSLGDPFFDEWIADDGLSGAQILDLADAIQPGGFDDFNFMF